MTLLDDKALREATLYTDLINALAKSTHGFHSSQLELIMPIIESYTESRIQQTMEKFKIKKGVEYKIFASDKAIVLENMNYTVTEGK